MQGHILKTAMAHTHYYTYTRTRHIDTQSNMVDISMLYKSVKVYTIYYYI